MTKKKRLAWRYDKPWLHQEDGPKLSPEEEAACHSKIAEIFRQLNEESEYIPLPERLEKVNDLIVTASTISRDYEIDMDIEQNTYGIDFKIYYFGGLFFGEAKRFIGKLFLLCDDVTIYTPKNIDSAPEGCSGVIHFTYKTHRHFVAGQEILL